MPQGQESLEPHQDYGHFLLTAEKNEAQIQDKLRLDTSIDKKKLSILLYKSRLHQESSPPPPPSHLLFLGLAPHCISLLVNNPRGLIYTTLRGTH